MMNGWLRYVGVSLCMWSSYAVLTPQVRAESRTWKYLSELSDDERQHIDPRTDTPRDAALPYLPAEPYPFTPPYTAEEMGYRAMEFPQRPRWSCVLANLFATISSSGSLIGTGQAVSYMSYPSTSGVATEVTIPGGDVVYRYLIQNIHPPEAYGSMNLMVRYRTDQTHFKKEDVFNYSPSLRRVRHQNTLPRSQRYAQMAMTFDDSSGRSAWEFSWTMLGTDVLYETVRFPVTRPQVLVTQEDGSFREVAAKKLKPMGDAYPAYTADEGVPCYVVEARAKEDWLPQYARPRIVYWLDQRAFYPLRAEMYDRDNHLVMIEVRMTKLANPALGERGYSPFIVLYWDLQADLLTYNIRDGIRPMDWSEADQLSFFQPDFLRRQWLLMPVRSYLGVDRPDEFFLRPHLEVGKFPAERPIEVSPEVMERIHAQDRAGRLVFTGEGVESVRTTAATNGPPLQLVEQEAPRETSTSPSR